MRIEDFMPLGEEQPPSDPTDTWFNRWFGLHGCLVLVLVGMLLCAGVLSVWRW